MKKLFALLLVLVMSISLVACGGGESTTTDSGSETDGPITIEFWHSMGSATGELVQEIVDEFNASQDEVFVEAIYQGDYNAAGTKLQAAVSGGNAPHVVQIEITRVGMYAAEGLLMDLQPFDDADDEFNAEDLYPGVMDFSYYEGQLVSLPNGRSTPVMYYNVDALKEAGFENAPENWDELREASNAVAKDGTLGYGISLGDSWYYLAMMLTAGGQVYNEEEMTLDSMAKQVLNHFNYGLICYLMVLLLFQKVKTMLLTLLCVMRLWQNNAILLCNLQHNTEVL